MTTAIRMLRTKSVLLICGHIRDVFMAQSKADNKESVYCVECKESKEVQRVIDVKFCKMCASTESITWWKCCPTHTTEQGDDVVCQTCAVKLHPNL